MGVGALVGRPGRKRNQKRIRIRTRYERDSRWAASFLIFAHRALCYEGVWDNLSRPCVEGGLPKRK